MTATYTVTVYLIKGTGRWAFRHPSGVRSPGTWASRAYAAKVARDNGMQVQFA